MTGLFADDEHFAEQFPLSPLDDYLIHQTPDPIRVMWTGDPRAYDRYWMLAHQAHDNLFIGAGGSFYPNLDRAEAYAIVNYQGRHASVRAFRPLGVDRADLRMGPIAARDRPRSPSLAVHAGRQSLRHQVRARLCRHHPPSVPRAALEPRERHPRGQAQ